MIKPLKFSDYEGKINVEELFKEKLNEVIDFINMVVCRGEEELLDEVAAKAHDIWARWMKYLFSKCKEDAHGDMFIPDEFIVRWKRQLETTYEELPEEEKESDREIAKEYLVVIRGE